MRNMGVPFLPASDMAGRFTLPSRIGRSLARGPGREMSLKGWYPIREGCEPRARYDDGSIAGLISDPTNLGRFSLPRGRDPCTVGPCSPATAKSVTDLSTAPGGGAARG